MSGKLVVSIKRLADFARAETSGADFIELRTDYFSEQQIMHLAQRSALPIILTVKGTITVLPAILKTLPRTVRYIDLDNKTVVAHRHLIPRRFKLILSFHDYTTTPSLARLNRLAQQALAAGAIPKIATYTRSVDDLVVIAHLQKRYGKNIIAIGMGELGMMTRLYNKSLLTFGALTRRTATAPGQLTVKQLQSGMQLFGLIGSDIAHSLSPRLHNTWFKQHHLPHHYQLWQTDQLDQFMEVFNWFGLPGASVTMPYKKSIMQYCDQIDQPARVIGAVNTLVRRGQQIVGYNTDWLGVHSALGNTLREARVLILGSGGAAAAVAYAAQQAGSISVRMLSRNQLPTTKTDFDIVVNATPVAQRLLVQARALQKKVVMDCIYGSAPTALLRQAQQQQARRIINGLPMLRAQAMAQFTLWTQ